MVLPRGWVLEGATASFVVRLLRFDGGQAPPYDGSGSHASVRHATGDEMFHFCAGVVVFAGVFNRISGSPKKINVLRAS